MECGPPSFLPALIHALPQYCPPLVKPFLCVVHSLRTYQAFPLCNISSMGWLISAACSQGSTLFTLYSFCAELQSATSTVQRGLCAALPPRSHPSECSLDGNSWSLVILLWNYSSKAGIYDEFLFQSRVVIIRQYRVNKKSNLDQYGEIINIPLLKVTAS